MLTDFNWIFISSDSTEPTEDLDRKCFTELLKASVGCEFDFQNLGVEGNSDKNDTSTGENKATTQTSERSEPNGDSETKCK